MYVVLVRMWPNDFGDAVLDHSVVCRAGGWSMDDLVIEAGKLIHVTSRRVPLRKLPPNTCRLPLAPEKRQLHRFAMR